MVAPKNIISNICSKSKSSCKFMEGFVGMKMKLKEICEINPKTREIDDDTEVSFVPMPSVTEDGKIDTSDIRSYQDVKKGYTVFQEGDVLFAKITPCMENGKGAIAYGLMNGKGCGSSEFHVLRPNKDVVTAEWIYYLTAWEWFRNEAEKHMTGSAGQKRVPKAYLENYVVNVPSLEEQKKQTKVLVQLQQIIDDRKKELICLDELIKARFVELFGDPIFNQMNWDTDAVENLCAEIYGGGTPSKAHPEYYEDGDIPWVSSKDMKTDVLYDSQIKINQLGVENSTAKMVPINSVIMVIRSGILKHTLPVAINVVPITVNQDLKVFIPNERVLSLFLMYQFKMLEKDILSGVRAVTADNIEFSSLKERKIIVPPIELQEQFVSFVEQTDKSKVVVQKALDETQQLFDSLMQKYFG